MPQPRWVYLLFGPQSNEICQVLLDHGLQLVRDKYGNHHVKFADYQIALGYFLLNTDQVVSTSTIQSWTIDEECTNKIDCNQRRHQS